MIARGLNLSTCMFKVYLLFTVCKKRVQNVFLTHISLASFFVGHGQTVQNQIRRLFAASVLTLTWVITVCLQNGLLKFE